VSAFAPLLGLLEAELCRNLDDAVIRRRVVLARG